MSIEIKCRVIGMSSSLDSKSATLEPVNQDSDPAIQLTVYGTKEGLKEIAKSDAGDEYYIEIRKARK